MFALFSLDMVGLYRLVLGGKAKYRIKISIKIP